MRQSENHARRRRLLAMLSLVALWVALRNPELAAAQEVVRDSISCPRCVISIAMNARMGDRDGPESFPHLPHSVVTDSRGRFWLLFSDEPPAVFRQDGAFLQSVGGSGSGPGEYRSPRAALAVGDSVAVFDVSGRVTVVGPDLSYVRDTQLVGPSSLTGVFALRWPDSVVVAGLSRDAAGVGWPLHLTDLGGRPASVVRSFGSGDGRYIQGSRRFLRHVIASSRTGGTWSTSQYDYQVTRWRRNATTDVSLRVQSAWAPTQSTGLMGGPEVAPGPLIRAIHEDRRGLLWIVGWVAADDWRDVWKEVLRRNGRTALQQGEMAATMVPLPHQLYRTRIEVVDVSAGAIIARHDFETGDVLEVLDDGRLVIGYETDEGILYIEIATATIEGTG